MHRVAAEVILSYPGLRSSGSVEYDSVEACRSSQRRICKSMFIRFARVEHMTYKSNKFLFSMRIHPNNRGKLVEYYMEHVF